MIYAFLASLAVIVFLAIMLILVARRNVYLRKMMTEEYVLLLNEHHDWRQRAYVHDAKGRISKVSKTVQ